MAQDDFGAATFSNLVELAQARLGGRVIAVTDEFFAEAKNLIEPGRGVFLPDEYTDRGKWMDGWESRRKRELGYDWCILKLGLPGQIQGLDIDTNHFLGNHPAFASVESCEAPEDASAEDLEGADWTEILPQTGLKRGSQNLFSVCRVLRATHVRLNIFPDGGVARFRVYGDVDLGEKTRGPDEVFDLAALVEGGRVLACNDMFFGAKDNLIMPGRSVNMGDGWETRRKRDWSPDWLVLELAARGTLDSIELDTNHFKGNFPESAWVEGLDLCPEATLRFYAGEDPEWTPVLPRTKLKAHEQAVFEDLENRGPFTHLKLSIFPCGGVSRLRARGKKA